MADLGTQCLWPADILGTAHDQHQLGADCAKGRNGMFKLQEPAFRKAAEPIGGVDLIAQTVTQ